MDTPAKLVEIARDECYEADEDDFRVPVFSHIFDLESVDDYDFDEVEAALDDVNVARYAKYVRRMTKNTQFILITHRRGTMEEADVLYGVTMQEEGVSKLLELKSAEMAKKLGLTT